MGGGGGGILSCIKMGSSESNFNEGSNESHFNDSVGSDVQSHKTVSTNHNLFEEKHQWRAKVVPNQGPSVYQPNALPLGQTGSCLGLLDKELF